MRPSDMGWAAMVISITVVCLLLLAIVHVPGFGPSEDVLSCDREGGYWSSDTGTCQKSDSPAAGLAA